MTRKNVTFGALDMPLPQYISRRGEQLQYRRAIPKDLWPVTGRAPFAQSLRTRDPVQALRARPEAERRYQAIVDEAREAIARRSNAAPITKADADAIATRWFLASLASAEDYRAAYVASVSVERAVDDAGWAAEEARRALAEGDLSDQWRLARCLTEEAGLTPEPLATAALVRLLGRAAIALHEVERGRLVARYDIRPADAFFGSAMDAPPPLARVAAEDAGWRASGEPKKPERRLSDLIAAYKADRWPKLSAASHRAYGPAFRLLEGIIGPETPLGEIDRDAGRRLLAAAQGLPKGIGKSRALAGLSVPAAIAAGARLGLPRLAPKTINDGYLANLKGVFGWAVSEQWMGSNPMARLSVADTTLDEDRRDPIGGNLAAVFGGAPWHPRDASGNPALYWAPLLGLYHGLRLGEAVGLRTDDIGEDGGFPVVIIRSGKTVNARRILPLHPELVRLGFVEVAHARREAGAIQLFEGERADSRGYWGRRVSGAFNAILVARGVKTDKRSFHSLRHDFEDALREADLHGTALGAYLAGRSQAGKVEAAYGSGYSTDAKAVAIAKVNYPALRLPGPASHDETSG